MERKVTLKLTLIVLSCWISIFANAQKKEKTLAETKKDIEIKGEQSTKVQVGEMAPNFTVTMLNNKQIKLSHLRGKVVMLNFWATWCSPCMQEFKEIPKQIINRFKNDDFVLLPISRGEKQEVVKKKIKKLKHKGIHFLVGLDPQKKIYNQYASKYIPRNFIIDKEGRIVFISVGNSEEKMHNMIKAIQKALKK